VFFLLQDPSSAIPVGTLLAIFITFVSYISYAFMMGGCILRTASGNVTEYLLVKGEAEEWRMFSNCTDRSCPYGLHNDSQVCLLTMYDISTLYSFYIIFTYTFITLLVLNSVVFWDVTQRMLVKHQSLCTIYL
jgi:amino acid transporter